VIVSQWPWLIVVTGACTSESAYDLSGFYKDIITSEVRM